MTVDGFWSEYDPPADRWSICLSPEGWQDIRRELRAWGREDLANAISTDEYQRLRQDFSRTAPGVCGRMAQALKKRLLRLSRADLVDHCMGLIEFNNSCDEGGENYWIDRCGVHKVHVPEEKVANDTRVFHR
jgi:hypothetical protein